MRGPAIDDMSIEYRRNGYPCKLFLLGFVELIAGVAITIFSVLVLQPGAFSYIGAHTIVNGLLLLSVPMNAYVLEHCFICIHITSLASGFIVAMATAVFRVLKAIATRLQMEPDEIYVGTFLLLSVAFISSFAQVIMCARVAILISRHRPGPHNASPNVRGNCTRWQCRSRLN